MCSVLSYEQCTDLLTEGLAGIAKVRHAIHNMIMFNQVDTRHDDSDLIYLFKNLEKLMTGDKANMDWTVTTDFKLFSQYMLQDINNIQQHLKSSPDDHYLHTTCRHIFNILDWIKLIVEDAGFPTFGTTWESFFQEHFNDSHILQHLYDESLNRWLKDKNGQFELGINTYTIIDSRLHYRNSLRQWFEVDKATAFDLLPDKQLITNPNLIQQLNSTYQDTWYDDILTKWTDSGYGGKLGDDFFHYPHPEADPNEYLEFSVKQIERLLHSPVSIGELERWNGSKIADIEDIIKIVVFVLDVVKKRRQADDHTLYLLRDCIIFNEAQKTLDILTGKTTSSDQVLIGRKLLSHKPGAWGYYSGMLDALYNAHLRYPEDFLEFYIEFSRLMDLFAEVNPKFSSVIDDLEEYIRAHLKIDKKKVIVFDIGFQGSIALLVKYIIDSRISMGKNLTSDVEIAIGAQWSMKLFGERYVGDYFPMLNRVQLLKRSNELYQYKDDSLSSAKLTVVMGNSEQQRRATIELAVLVMVAQLEA